MATLNYKHLRYFWTVARCGSIAKAAEQLHLTPQSISGQLSEFAETLGVELFRKVGRRLEVTETGNRVLRHADEIFSAGDALLELVRARRVRGWPQDAWLLPQLRETFGGRSPRKHLYVPIVKP